MKRDARIGLAVVLVLGLMVTLLVGRALYKRNAAQPATEADEVAQGDGSASYSEPVRAPGTETPASPSAAPANVNLTPAVVTPGTPAPHVTDTVVHTPEQTNPALNRFINDETHNTASHTEVAAPIAATPATNPGVSAPPHGASAPAPAGDHNVPPPSNNGGGLEDHESTAPSVSDTPTDGFGYTVTAGDNMWKISAKVYGDGKYTQKIVEANSHLDTQKLKVGSVIHIPSIPHKTILMKLPSFADAQKDTAVSSAGSAVAATTSHTSRKAEATKDQPAAASSAVSAPSKSDTFAGTTHKVEAGDTLGSIAKKYYGSGGPKSVARILAANKGLDPAKLKVGQEIEVPAAK